MEFVALCVAVAALMIASKSRRRANEFGTLSDRLDHVHGRVQALELETLRLRTRLERAESQAQVATPVVVDMPLPTHAADVPAVVIPRESLEAQVGEGVEEANGAAEVEWAEEAEEIERAEEVAPTMTAAHEMPEPELAMTYAVGLEEQLGANWLNKLGIVILVLGIASFLAYQLTNLLPPGRVAVGILVSLVMLGGGVWLERSERYRIPARAVIGGGWALLYFVAFAAHFVPATHVIDSQVADLTLMLAVAAAMVWHTLRYDSEWVTGIAFFVAFATITIHHDTALSLAAGGVLAAGLVAVVRRKHWFALELVGVLATFFNHFLWLQSVVSTRTVDSGVFHEFWVSTALLVFYWATFRTSYVLSTPRTEEEEAFSSLSAVVTSGLFLGLMKFQSVHPEWAFRSLLLLGAVEFLLAQLPIVGRRRTAFIVLTVLGTAMTVGAIPLHFSGTSMAVVWLVEAEALFVAGVWAREVVFRRLGLLTATLVTVELLAVEAGPAFHAGDWHVAVTLLTASVVFYVNVYAFGRRFRSLFSERIDAGWLRATGYFAATAIFAAVAILSDTWMATGWVACAFVLAWLSQTLDDGDLATQAVGLAVVGTAQALSVNMQSDVAWGVTSLRVATVGPIVGLLYAVAHVFRRRAVGEVVLGTVFTWAAAFTLGLLAWHELLPINVAVAWVIFGIVLLEIGIALNWRQARWQSYVALTSGFARIFFVNLNAAGQAGAMSPRIYTVLPLAAAFFYAHVRLSGGRNNDEDFAVPAGAAAWFGTIAVVALVFFELPSDWVAPAWSVLGSALAVVAWASHEEVFVDQAVLLGGAAAFRAVAFNLMTLPSVSTTPWHGRAGTVWGTVLGLAATFLVARRLRSDLSGPPEGVVGHLRAHPDRTLFFITVALVTVALGMVMRSGMITVSWGVEGLLVFVLALWAEERSFRLTALSLLLLCVAKIGLVDFWALGLRDKWITLVILGAALMLVSFLYSRYREALRRYL